MAFGVAHSQPRVGASAESASVNEPHTTWQIASLLRGVQPHSKSVGRRFRSEISLPAVQQRSTAAGPLFNDS